MSERPEKPTDTSAATPAARFWFSSTLGQQTLRDILRPLLPFDPHDYLLEWTAAVLDGSHLLGITATGDGKSCMFYFPLLVMQHYGRLEKKPAGWAWPANPMVLVICPTKCIEDEQEADMLALNIKALALHQDRLDEARLNGVNLWKQARSTDILFLGPEQLSGPGFAYLVKDRSTWERISLGCVDEVHLVAEWTKNGFRPRFMQIGQLLARLHPRVRLCALSATVHPSAERALCSALGLFYDDVAIKRRSNRRGNVQFERRLLKSSLSGSSFPELDWILADGGSGIIYVDSISASWRIAGHLCRQLPMLTAEQRFKRIRLFNALNTPEHNDSTRMLLKEWPGTIAIATNSLSIGFSSSLIRTVAVIGPRTLDEVVQKGGRSNRVSGSGTSVGRAIVYQSAKAYKTAAAVVDAAGEGGDQPSKSKGAPEGMELPLARFTIAPCGPAAIDVEYKNPRRPQVCNCGTCDGHPISGDARVCACDGCLDRQATNSTAESLPNVAITARPQKAKRSTPRSRTITKAMRELIIPRLESLREDLYFSDELPACDVSHLPISLVFPDDLILALCNSIFDLDTSDRLRSAVQEHPFVVQHLDKLSVTLEKLRLQCRSKRKCKRAQAIESESSGDLSDSASGSESDDGNGQPPNADTVLPGPGPASRSSVRRPLDDVTNHPGAPVPVARGRGKTNSGRPPAKRARPEHTETAEHAQENARPVRPAAALASVTMKYYL